MDHPTHIPDIVFDDNEHEYYNKHTDIFLTEDDIKYYGLKPYEDLVLAMPTKRIPPSFFMTNKTEQAN
jgi:hypothetical protein